MSDVLTTLETTAALYQGGFATSVIVIRTGTQIEPREGIISHLSEADAITVLGQLNFLRATIEEDLINKMKTRKYVKELHASLSGDLPEETRTHILAELEEFRAAGYEIPE